MEVEASAPDLAAGQAGRRAAPRLPVDSDATLLLVKHGSGVACRVTDLSMGGCRIETRTRFVAGIQLRVEVSFAVHGLQFRLNGTIQWTDGRRQTGIQFVEMSARRRDELQELVRELELENAARAAAELNDTAIEQRAAQADDEAGAEERQPFDTEPESDVGSQADSGADLDGLSLAAEDSLSAVNPETPAPATNAERRASTRHEVDTSAAIYLVNVGSRLRGRIVDLSQGGCRICTNENFPVGIYTRVEIEFQLHGLPFRIGGVVQAIHDQRQVGMRFLDVSPRKRAQMEQLIEEINEFEKMKAAEPSGEPLDAATPENEAA
jgi:c-di-GMP-binding flagellar brake protein YcgR